MPSPRRARKIALVFFASGWLTCLAAFVLPGLPEDHGLRTCLFIYGLSAFLFGGGAALFRHLDVQAQAALARGEDVLARWQVEPAAWEEFVAADQHWNQVGEFLPNELSIPVTVPPEDVGVIVGRTAIQVGESVHRLADGMPEVTEAALHDRQPAVVELQLYYRGGGHGASGIPHSPRRATLRFPVGRGCWREAGVVVAHYRGELGRKPDFFHGKADGSNPEDLSKCYHCGYETYRLLSHCPQCGRSLQSKRWSRRYGAILSVLGLIISSVIGFVLLLLLPKLLHAGAASGGVGFSGSAAQAWLVLGVLLVVELFGVTTMCYGLWQVVTGRRSKRVIYFAVVLVLLLLVFAFLL